MQRYRVAIIGTGFAERVQLPAFQRHPRFVPVAVAARDEEGTRLVAERSGLDRWYTDWRRMLDEGDFDLLSIVTPPHLHYEMTMAAFDAGVHVLCEKPMALNAAEAEAMLHRARETGRTAMINHEFRHLAARHRFGELLRDGYIGKLHRLVVRFHQGWLRASGRTWNWWADFDRGGGLLGAIGSHYLDAARVWTAQEPVRVWGRLSAFVPELPEPGGSGTKAVTSDDSFLAVVEMDGGTEVLFDLTAAARPRPGNQVVAIGSEGTLVLEEDKRLLGGRDGEMHELPFEELEREPGEEWLIAPFTILLDSLARGLDEGTSPTPNFSDGLAHQYFIDAVKRSNASGASVPFPPRGPVEPGTLPRGARELS